MCDLNKNVSKNKNKKMPFSNNNKKDDMRGSIGNTRKTIKTINII